MGWVRWQVGEGGISALVLEITVLDGLLLGGYL